MLALTAVLLLSPAVLAQTGVTVETTLFDPQGQVTQTLEPGARGSLRVDVTNTRNATVNVTLTLDGAEGAIQDSGQTGPLPPNATRTVALKVHVPGDQAEGPLALNLAGTVAVQNATSGNWALDETFDRTVTFTVVLPPGPPEPGLPLLPLAVGAVLLVGAGAAAYLKLRRPKDVLPPEPTEAERQRAVQERRESIHDAKVRDVVASLDRARGRLDRGEITRYQFDRIEEQKRDQLRELGVDPDEVLAGGEGADGGDAQADAGESNGDGGATGDGTGDEDDGT